MPYLFICVKKEWLNFPKRCFTDGYIIRLCQWPKGYCKNEDDGLSLQRKNEHEMKIKEFGKSVNFSGIDEFTGGDVG